MIGTRTAGRSDQDAPATASAPASARPPWWAEPTSGRGGRVRTADACAAVVAAPPVVVAPPIAAASLVVAAPPAVAASSAVAHPAAAAPSAVAAPGLVAPGVSTPQLGAAARTPGVRSRRARVLRVPAWARVPFTLGYALVLIATSVFADLGDPGTVDTLLAESSTDVSHLAERPLLVLAASCVWVAGGLLSPYLLLFLLVIGSLERRLGWLRTAGVFLLGHVMATMVTEASVAVSVAVGHLPGSSLRRMDYGISYGLLASVAALAGLLRFRARLPLLAVTGAMLAYALVRMDDPLTDWGHVLALLTGLACWPWVRQAARSRSSKDGTVTRRTVPRGAG
ncbi:rhomboid-like protein [Streptomyces sp. P1-3]|uniref:rhomboid-like protein n=1 Tax=Streptomyces sp. P1-3 TaxID=3421658 RepID=UPI003D3630D1